MRIASFELFSFALPLKRPLPTKNETLSQRSGLILELRDDSGHVGLGEISPLPDFNSETLDEARAQLVRTGLRLCGQKAPDGLERLDGSFRRWLDKLGCGGLAPSVRFGLESATLHLIAEERKITIADLLVSWPRPSVTVNGLLGGSPAQVMERADELVKLGYRAFKLKVGRRGVDDCVQGVRRVRRLIGARAVLRLDANRAWSVDDAIKFCNGVMDLSIEYIEEPVNDVGLLRELLKENRLSIPVALDETVAEMSITDLNDWRTATAIILKPTLLGLEESFLFARKAKELGITPVVSSAFESGLGISILGQAAAAINASDIPAGLGTFDWFAEDLWPTPFPIHDGCICPGDLANPFAKLRRRLLRELPHD
jgi:O-succinylbenzoate synthase